MKLVTKQQSRFGQKIVVAFLGEVQFDENGEIELQSHQFQQARELVKISNSNYSILGDPEGEQDLGQKSEEDEFNKGDGDTINPQVEDGEPLNETELRPLTEQDLEITLKSNPDLTEEDIERMRKLLGTEMLLPKLESQPKSEDSSTEEELIPIPQDVKDSLVQSLEDKDFQELKEFAAENGFPEEEWQSRRNGKQLKSYLVEKINSL